MELGMMGLPRDGELEAMYELRIKHCGVGAAAHAIESSWDGINKAVRLGLNPIGIVPVDKEEAYDGMFYYDFSKKLRVCVREFPYKVYVIWEEPSLPYIVGDKFKFRDYQTLLRVAYETIKEADPTIQVWNGGIGQHGGLWTIQEFLTQAIDYTDAVNLHMFHFDADWRRVVELISGLISRTMIFLESIGKPKPIVCTEWGYPTSENETTYGSFVDPTGVVPAVRERDQALIVREVLRMCAPVMPQFHFAMLQSYASPHWGGHTGSIDENGKKLASYYAILEWLKEQEEDAKCLPTQSVSKNILTPESPHYAMF